MTTIQTIGRIMLVVLAFTALQSRAGENSPSVDPLHITFTPRTPEQMAAFYEARGFPAPMVEALKQQCFITVGIHNLSDQVIWLDLSSWKFTADGKPLLRRHRSWWKQKWEQMGIPLASQSTFRWTLLPEQLDYFPGEHEGGNILLPPMQGTIYLDTAFATGKDRKGPTLLRRYELTCKEDLV